VARPAAVPGSLRQHPELAAEYVTVERLAARAHENDREASTRSEDVFVREVLRDAARGVPECPGG
jgi:GrpB-like predicted nucleotidyltransferase (UPF0157 family)